MATALLLQVPTVASASNSTAVLREVSTSHSNSNSSCKLGSSTIFGSSLRFRNNFSGLEAAGDSSYKLNITSGKGDEILPKSSASSSAVSVQETQPFESSTYLEDQGREPEHPYAHLKVGERWPEFQGKNNWAGLLDPLDPVLRGEILRYGEFCQVTYDSFDFDSHSRYCGSCKWNKQKLLAKTGLANRGYEVTDYLYSTSGLEVTKIFKKFQKDDDDDDDSNKSWDQESNWMGYIAVSTNPEEIARLGRRDIVIVWRGTVTGLEWAENCRDYLAPGAFDVENGLGTEEIKFEAGFMDLYVSKCDTSRFTKKSAREQVHAAIRRLCRKYKGEQLTFSVTGHSLGSAMAMFTAYDLAQNAYQWRQKNPQYKNFNKIPITVFSFAGPRVGNDAFRDRMDELGVKVLRLVNKHDNIPKIPGILLNEGLDFVEKNAEWLYNWIERLPWTYTHCGVELRIDHMVSPYIKKMPVYEYTKGALNAHNLEGYLHVLNGFTGVGNKEFKPVFERDLALINKDSDILRSKHGIPPAWRQEENKGLMRCSKSGRWIPRYRDPEDIPQYEDLNEEPDLEFAPTNTSS